MHFGRSGESRMKRITKLLVTFLITLFIGLVAEGCTTGLVTKAASTGIDIISDVFEYDEQVSPNVVTVKFPQGEVIEEKPGWWERLWGAEEKSKEVRTNCYIIKVDYGKDHIYYQIRTVSTKIDENIIRWPTLELQLRRDDFKDDDLVQPFTMNDAYDDEWQFIRIETDDTRRLIIQKKPVVVEVQ